MSDKINEKPIWGSIHLTEDGNLIVDIPQDTELHGEEFAKPKTMMDFIIFAANNQDCINLFNCAEQLKKSLDENDILTAQVQKNLEKTTAVLNHKEVWQFIDDFHSDKFKFADETSPTSRDKDFAHRWLNEKDKITYH